MELMLTKIHLGLQSGEGLLLALASVNCFLIDNNFCVLASTFNIVIFKRWPWCGGWDFEDKFTQTFIVM